MASLLRLAVFCVFLGCALASSSFSRSLLHEDSEHGTRTISPIVASLAGLEDDDRTLSDRLLGYNSEEGSEDIEAEKYGYYLASSILYLIFFLIFTLVFMLCFCPLRYCCNLCGGRTRGNGVCHNKGTGCCNNKSAAEEHPFEGYNHNEITCLKFFTIVLLALGVAALIIGFSGDAATSSSVDSVFDSVVQVGENIKAQVVAIRDGIAELRAELVEGGDFRDAIQTVDDMVADVETTREDANEYDGYRSQGLIGFLLLPVCILACLVTFAFCGISPMCLNVCCAYLFLFLILLLYIVVAVHLVLTTVFSDLCVEMKHFSSDDPAEQNSGGLNEALGCDGESELQAFVDTAYDGIEIARQATCESIFSSCNQTVAGNQTLFYGPGCDIARNYTSAEVCNTTYIGQEDGLFADVFVFPDGSTVAECAEDPACPGGEDSQEAIAEAQKLPKYEALIRDLIEPLLDCTFFKDQVAVLEEPVCDKVVPAFRAVSSSLGILIITGIAAAATFIAGEKRFLNSYSEYVAGSNLNMAKQVEESYEEEWSDDYDDDDDFDSWQT